MVDANKNIRVVLIGAAGCGKTTLGKMLAEALDVPFYDTDDLSAEKSAEKIGDRPEDFDYFEGLRAFTQDFLIAQTTILTDLARSDESLVVATGAELPLSRMEAGLLKQIGRIIWVKRDPDKIITEIREQTGFAERPQREASIRELSVMLYRNYDAQYDALADQVLDNDGDEKQGLAKLLTMVTQSLP
jgi:shikimate kinase